MRRSTRKYRRTRKQFKKANEQLERKWKKLGLKLELARVQSEPAKPDYRGNNYRLAKHLVKRDKRLNHDVTLQSMRIVQR